MNKQDRNSGYKQDISKENIQVVTRLSPEVYKALEAQCPISSVGQTTTDIQAGMMIGAEIVLRKLRQGFVHGS